MIKDCKRYAELILRDVIRSPPCPQLRASTSTIDKYIPLAPFVKKNKCGPMRGTPYASHNALRPTRARSRQFVVQTVGLA
jgi:hypothetical protein